jgi:hypothetical protein
MKTDIFLERNITRWGRLYDDLMIEESLLSDAEIQIFKLSDGSVAFSANNKNLRLSSEEIVNSVVNALNLDSEKTLINLQMAKMLIENSKAGRVYRRNIRFTEDNERKIEALKIKLNEQDIDKIVRIILTTFIAIHKSGVVYGK